MPLEAPRIISLEILAFPPISGYESTDIVILNPYDLPQDSQKLYVLTPEAF